MVSVASAAAVSAGVARPTVRGRCAVGSAVVGSVLFLAGQALLPQTPDGVAKAFPVIVAHRDRFMAAHLLTAAGGFLLVLVMAVFLGLAAAGRPGGRIVRVGAALFGVGTFFNALDYVAEGYAAYAATSPRVDDAAGLAVLREFGTGAVGVPLGFWSIPALAIGLIVVAAGLLRGHVVPAWQPILLIVGVLLAMVFAGRGPIVALTQLPLTVAIIALGVTAWRRGQG